MRKVRVNIGNNESFTVSWGVEYVCICREKEIEKARWAITVEGLERKILHAVSANERTKPRVENKPSWK